MGQDVGVNLENSEDGQMFVMEFQRHTLNNRCSYGVFLDAKFCNRQAVRSD